MTDDTGTDGDDVRSSVLSSLSIGDRVWSVAISSNDRYQQQCISNCHLQLE